MKHTVLPLLFAALLPMLSGCDSGQGDAPRDPLRQQPAPDPVLPPTTGKANAAPSSFEPLRDTVRVDSMRSSRMMNNVPPKPNAH